MSKRNFILLIIVLIILGVIAFGFFSSIKGPSVPAGGEEGGTNFFAKFNPFGKSQPNNTPKTEEPPADISGNEPPPEETTAQVEIKLKKISSMPVAGFGVFMKERFKEIPVLTPPEPTEPAPAVTPTSKIVTKKPVPPPKEFASALRYVDRATGNIYQTFADKVSEQKFSSTIIPKVYEAYFGDKAEKVVLRYLKADETTIATFAGTLPKEILGVESTGSNELKGTFLPENITDMSISPDLLKIFYVFEGFDSATGVTADTTGEKKVQVFSSAFDEWLTGWPNKNMITMTTKPSASVPGYMYAIDPAKKDFNRVLGNINGLTTLASPDGKLVLFGDNNLSLSLYNISKKTVESLGVKTLPEKCVWNKTSVAVYCAVPKITPQGFYPDDWYRGEVSFSDDIWKIDMTSKNTDLVSNPISETGQEVDGVKLALDKDENYLFFVDKKDSFLWELELK